MLHVHDPIPDLAGQVCEALLVQGHYYRGRAEDGPPVLLLKVQGAAWHRVFIQAGVLFWQIVDGVDSPDHDRHYYVLTDLAAAHGLVGARLDGVSTEDVQRGVVRLAFAGGPCVTLREGDGRSQVTVETSPPGR